MSMRFVQTDMTTNYSNIYILSLPTIHMKCTMRYGGMVVGGKWSLSTGVDNDTFTCIKDRALYHAWGLGGWVNDCPLGCCGISIFFFNICFIYSTENSFRDDVM